MKELILNLYIYFKNADKLVCVFCYILKYYYKDKNQFQTTFKYFQTEYKK